ncbi:MAG TPA: hypothetical protein PKA55_18110 [Rhodoblastus sp.]|nr:hypothetical protein [Rhodoblastus sp.]
MRWILMILVSAICLAAAAIITAASSLPFWLSLIMSVAAMILNGFFAEWEDRQPGGFYNPCLEKTEDKKD